MKYNFPKLKISNEDKVWLKACYERIYDENIDPKSLKVLLRDVLPPRYSEYEIDSRLISRCNITLLGIWHIDPDSMILENTEKVINYIKQTIIEHPDTDGISDNDIINNIDIDKKQICTILKLINTIGLFWTKATGRANISGYSEIMIDSEEVFDEYLAFENLEKQVNFHIKRFEKQRSNDYVTLGLSSEQNLCKEKLSIVPNTAFIIMTIDKNNPQTEDICKVIKEVFLNYGIEAKRADEIEHSDRITDVILDNIKKSEFLIADVSGERPNIYYEIGYAHALAKRPIIYRKTGTKIHFDLANHNIPEYEGIFDLKEKLTKRLKEMTGRTLK